MEISLSKVYLLRQNNMDLDQKHCLFSLQFCGFQCVDWDTKEICSLCICYLKIIHYKVEDFQMAHLGYL